MHRRGPALSFLLLMASSVVCAQTATTVPLRSVPMGRLSHPSSSWSRTSAMPVRGDAPRGYSLYEVRVAGAAVRLAVKQTSPHNCFADLDGNGRITDPEELAEAYDGKGRGTSYTVFGPAHVLVPGSNPPRSAWLAVEVTSLSRRVISVSVLPAGVMSGQLTLDGRTHAVEVIDGDFDGRYDGAFSGRSGAHRGDWLCVDLNDDGKVDPNMFAARELMPLSKTLRLGDSFYDAEMAPDGSSLGLTTVQPEFGYLDVGCTQMELALLSDCGPISLQAGRGRWRVPAGDYAAYSLMLTATDGRGAAWRLYGQRASGPAASFSIAPGETLSLDLGPPVELRTEPQQVDRNTLSIGLELVGRGGEEYAAGAYREGKMMDPPRFRILDANGNVGVTDSFEYG